MAVLDLAFMGHPILARIADPVTDPCAAAIAMLIADMEETMIAVGGVGLAAPQVKQSLQLVIFDVPEERAGDGMGLPRTILMNPVIEPLSDMLEDGYEACLSVPGLTGVVPRWQHIGYRGVDATGQLIEREAKGFHARVVQHECDHLWGRLYVSRMRDLSTLAYRSELLKLVQEGQIEEGQPPLQGEGVEETTE
jgi:peptide deformylase